MAKRKTSRQVAASRRNIKKAQIASARKRRGLSKAGVLKAGVAIGAVYGGSVIARKVYNRDHIYLHHSTTKEAHSSIKRSGFRKGHSDHGDQVFFSTKKQKEYGPHVISLRVHKKVFGTHARKDPHNGFMRGYDNFYTLPVGVANRHLRRR